MTRREHLWELLQEEAAEVIKVVCKIKRFGLDNIQPASGKLNSELLNDELNDFFAAIEMLVEDGVTLIPDESKVAAKKEKVEKYLEISKENGTYREN